MPKLCSYQPSDDGCNLRFPRNQCGKGNPVVENEVTAGERRHAGPGAVSDPGGFTGT